MRSHSTRVDFETVVGLFVPDVRVGSSQMGRDALRANLSELLRDLGVTILHVANHVIEVIDDDHATGVVSCRGEIEMGEQWIVQSIQYHDSYERREGSWLFVRRRHLLFYGADMLQRPIGLPLADWPASATGKGELPEAFPTWKAFHEQLP